MFIELTPPKYPKQNPTILNHLLKQTRQTTTTQPNNIITLPTLILKKNHRKTPSTNCAKTILITQNPIQSKMKNQHHEAQNHHISKHHIIETFGENNIIITKTQKNPHPNASTTHHNAHEKHAY